MYDRFCLNAVTIKTTPVERQIPLAREAGFHQIGLWAKDIEAAIDRGKPLALIKADLNSSGISVAELCYIGGWQDANHAQVEGALKQTRRLCEVARALECGIIVAVPAMTPGWMRGGHERFRRICQVAAEYDVRIALEFPGNAPEVKDLRTARELVAAADCANGGLVIDTFHFFLGGSKPADFASLLPEQIFLVHVSDAMNLPLDELRIPHDNRTFPGDGVIDFAPIWQQLNRLHYEGPISLEIWNRRLHQCDPAEVLTRACESLRRIEDALNHPERP